MLTTQSKAKCTMTRNLSSRECAYVMGSSSAVGTAVRNPSSSSRPYSDFAKCRNLARSDLEIPPIAMLVQSQYYDKF